jgi:hypothetical protein
MGLNAIGAYGFLAKAHIGHAAEGDVAVAGCIAEVDACLAAQRSLVTDPEPHGRLPLKKSARKGPHGVCDETRFGRTA